MSQVATAFNLTPPEGRSVYCVLGRARGGTTLIAGALRQLGVYMGDVNPDNCEDYGLLALREEAFSRQNAGAAPEEAYAGLRDHFAALNDAHRTWGWKDPLSYVYVDHLRDRLDGLRVVAVFRDPQAIALRERIDMHAPYRDTLSDALSAYEAILSLIERLAVPTLLVSYEKALLHPDAFWREIAEFTGARLDEEEIRALSSYIRAERNSAREDPHTREVDEIMRSVRLIPQGLLSGIVERAKARRAESDGNES